MIGPMPLRDVGVVALFELQEALRTRRILVMLALYLLGGLLMAWGFVEFLAQAEEAAAQALGTTVTARPGALTQQLLKEPTYQRFIRGFFRNTGEVEVLATLPPMSLFYAWSTFTFLPMLIVLTASDTIAQEYQSRGLRFLTFRTGRVELVVGKLVGQAILLAGVTLLMAGVYAGVAAVQLYGFEWESNLSALLFFWPKTVVYALPFLALTFTCSMVAPSTIVARAASILLILCSWALFAFLTFYMRTHPDMSWLAAFTFVMPFGHRDSLWKIAWDEVLGTFLILISLTGVYLAAGLAWFGRKDV